MRRSFLLIGLVVLLSGVVWAQAQKDRTIRFTARSQPEREGKFTIEEKALEWDGRETALVIVDVWDKHWCEGANKRCGEIAPKVNELAKFVRSRGGLVIHAPSDTMKYYEGSAARELAKSAPKATPPTPLKGWRYLDPTCESALPIDDSDGGCDCEPICAHPTGGKWPWTRQHPAIEVVEGDAVSQDGAEVYSLFAQRGIKKVIVCGVHLNMCVLGRTFAIRQLRTWGFDVVLVRDLTDTMYNPRRSPYVSHDNGTELMIAHVEKYWCPSTTWAEMVGKSK
jgi:nicotinamidase-related amidase